MTGPGSLKQKKRGGDLSVRGRDLSSAQLQVSEVGRSKAWFVARFPRVAMLPISLYRARQGKILPLMQVLRPLTIGREVQSFRLMLTEKGSCG